MRYCVILFDTKQGGHIIIGTGYTKIEATVEIGKLRDESLPAFYLTHIEYKKIFGAAPKIEGGA